MNAKTQKTVLTVFLFVLLAVLAFTLVFVAVVALTSPEEAMKNGEQAECASLDFFAVRWYLRAGRAGLSAAQAKLGAAYENGCGVTCDYRKALIWYEQCVKNGSAAEEELTASELGLGRVCLSGDHGLSEPDPANAYRWFSKAANAGSPEAMYRLGKMLADGVGCEKDETSSAFWIAKAAENGYRGESEYEIR